MLSNAPQQVKGLACTGLVEMSFNGRSDLAGLAGWGASACQPFIGGPEQRQVQLHREQQQEFPSHSIQKWLYDI